MDNIVVDNAAQDIPHILQEDVLVEKNTWSQMRRCAMS